MWEWAKKSWLKMKTPNGVAMSAGILGFFLLVIGIALIYIPAALITAGVLLIAWSALFARAIANNGSGA